MNANSSYFIGKDHTVCQDYALAWTAAQSGDSLAIVCDGCSASPDVEFGAQLLAKAAENTVFMRGVAKETITNPKLFGAMTIQTANKIFDILPILPLQALDATLLIAMVSIEKKLIAYMFGDGMLVHRKNTGVNTVHINLTSGAPDYLSYSLDPIREGGYRCLENNVKQISHTTNGQTIQLDAKPLEPYVYTCDVAEGEVIAVISDGINSFRKANNDPIPWSALVDEFTEFKNFEGEFVQRRLAAFKRKCLKEGTTHSDDISVAAIHVSNTHDPKGSGFPQREKI